MTHPRVRMPSHVTITTLDARTYASTHPCVVDLIAIDVESSRAISDGVVSSPPPVIEPAARTAPPPLGSRFEPHQALQSP
jgi:hypothetical protein